MTRWAATANENAAAADVTPLRVLVDLDFVSGHVYAHAGTGELAWGGNVYTGVGAFGGFEQIGEESGVVPRPVTLKLAAVPTELIPHAMTETYQGRAVTLYVGILAPATGLWVSNPEVLWSGVMDTMTVELGPQSGSISLVCEDPDYGQPMPRRYTLTDHQIDFPGDLGLQLLPFIPHFKSNWGADGYGYGTVPGLVPPHSGMPTRPAVRP